MRVVLITALGLIMTIAALICVIMLLRLRFRVIWNGSFKITLGVLCFHRQLYPKKPKKIRLRDYSPRAIERRKRKAAKKAAKESAKKAAKKSVSKENVQKKRKTNEITRLLRQLTRFAKLFIEKFGGILHIEITALRIKVATGDAANTGIAYGAAAQGVAYLLAFMENHVSVKYKGEQPVAVVADFCGDSFDADIDVTFSLRLGQLFRAFISSAITGIKSGKN